MVEIILEEQNKVKRMKRTEDSLRDFWDNIKLVNIQIIGISEEEETNKGYEKIFEEIIVENSQSSPRGTKSPTQENPRRNVYSNQTNKG